MSRWLGSLAAAYAVLTLGASPSIDMEESKTLATLRNLVLCANAYKADHQVYPNPTEGFVTVDFLRPYFLPVYINKMPEVDGWGNALRYFSDGKTVAFLSYGRDGKADRAYVPPQGLEPGDGDDFVWSGGHLVVCPKHLCELERTMAQKRTIVDMRSIGIAVESHLQDRGSLPEKSGYEAVAFIRSRVEPIYIAHLPLTDGWGNTLLYWSDGKSYRIVSPGADGTPDGPWDQVVPGTVTTTAEADLVFGDGKLLQGPQEEMR